MTAGPWMLEKLSDYWDFNVRALPAMARELDDGRSLSGPPLREQYATRSPSRFRCSRMTASASRRFVRR